MSSQAAQGQGQGERHGNPVIPADNASQVLSPATLASRRESSELALLMHVFPAFRHHYSQLRVAYEALAKQCMEHYVVSGVSSLLIYWYIVERTHTYLRNVALCRRSSRVLRTNPCATSLD